MHMLQRVTKFEEQCERMISVWVRFRLCVCQEEAPGSLSRKAGLQQILFKTRATNTNSHTHSLSHTHTSFMQLACA